MTFGKHLRQCRTLDGMGVRELARHLDVSGAFICRVEAGRCYPTPENVVAWARTVGADRIEAMARYMAEQYDCGDDWRVWWEPAARVVRKIEIDSEAA